MGLFFVPNFMKDPIADFTGDTQVVAKLLSELEESFPAVTPNPSDDYALIMYRSGQRSVVDYIRTLLEN